VAIDRHAGERSLRRIADCRPCAFGEWPGKPYDGDGTGSTSGSTLEFAMDHRPSVDLLESVHLFPGVYKIKAIGKADDDFETRVVEAVYSNLAARSDLDYTVRITPGGRHVAVTLDITVQNAEQVREIYADLRDVKGLTLLF
jgi:putative lipoic acid-binding regulatory protein